VSTEPGQDQAPRTAAEIHDVEVLVDPRTECSSAGAQNAHRHTLSPHPEPAICVACGDQSK
jgi:hypothetical protein